MRLLALALFSVMTLSIVPAEAEPVPGPKARKQRMTIADEMVIMRERRHAAILTEIAKEREQTTVQTAAHSHPEPVEPEPAMSINWDVLAECESNGEWGYGPHSNWGSGIFEGGLQFHPDTWDAFKPAGYPEAAYQASRGQQILVAEKVLDAQGLRAWPACTRKLGWR